jgi:predicted nucleotide-binding protein
MAKMLDDDRFSELKSNGASAPRNFSKEVFIVHGHDHHAKVELELMLTKAGLESIVLHRQPDMGRTLIEKFEQHANVGYAFVLLTPDDVAYSATDESKPDTKRKKERRARQNVILEFGFFAGQLGRARVCCLYKGGVTLPSDMDGLIHKEFKESVEELHSPIRIELEAAGYTLLPI